MTPIKILAVQNDKSLPPGLRAHPKDGGLDLICLEPVSIFSMQTKVIKTNLRLLIPDRYLGDVRPRSGLSKKGLLVHLSTIDADYTGTVHIIITNLSREVFNFKPGDRIGQFVLHSKIDFDLELIDMLPETERGESGFGDSGLNANEGVI